MTAALQPRAGGGGYVHRVSVVAAADLGTNSFHLIVAALDPSGHFNVLTREKDTVRLGSGGGDMTELRPDAIERGLAALRRMRSIAASLGAPELLAVATSAVREATNGDEFVTRARSEIGVDVEVVSGVEEARLIHQGVAHSAHVAAQRHLVVDIGGGSTEIVIGDRTTPVWLRSLKLGTIRLTDRFFPGGVTRPPAVKACAAYIDSFLGGLPTEAADVGFELAVGSSGTLLTLARMCDPANATNGGFVRAGGLTMRRSDLRRLTEQLAAARTPADRLRFDGLEERRADIIVAGALLATRLMELLGIDRLEVSDFALREGLIVEQIRRMAAPETPDGLGARQLTDVRRASVLYVAERFDESTERAEHITDLALDLFAGLAPLHGIDAQLDLLEAASLLHNVGMFISHSAHHRHSYYLIRNSEHLAGFTEREIEVVALVARYHRKSAPKPKHAEFAALAKADKHLVRWMSAVLRVAIGLDRTYRTLVRSVAVDPASLSRAAGDPASQRSHEPLRVLCRIDPEVDASVEMFTAHARSTMLSELAGVELEFVPVVEPSGPTTHPANGSGEPAS